MLSEALALAQEGIRIRAQTLFYDDVEETLEASGGVEIQGADFSLTAEHVRFSIPTLEVFVDTPFTASFGGARISGDALYFSFSRHEGWIEDANLTYLLEGRGELFFRGTRLSYTQGTWKGHDIRCSGCRREPPLVSLRAQEVTITPQGKVTIEGLALYVREQKILEIPWYTRIIGQGGGGFLPVLGFSRRTGWFTGFRYEYAPNQETLFLLRYTLATRGGKELKTDFLFEQDTLTGQAFWDTDFAGNERLGGSLLFRKGNATFCVLATRNENHGSLTLSRMPQVIASFDHPLGAHATLSGTLGYGYFATGELSGPRFDARLTLSYTGCDGGAELFGWGTYFADTPLFRVGGEVFLEKAFSPELRTRLSWDFVAGDPSPFPFDPQPRSWLSLEVLLGDEDASFLRVRGRYDLQAGDFDDWTIGFGVGNKDFTLGAEGVYSQDTGTLDRTRYFLRKTIEDCVNVEVSFAEPEGNLFVAVNFLGFDKPRRAKSLFEEEEPFDPLRFGRDLSTP